LSYGGYSVGAGLTEAIAGAFNRQVDIPTVFGVVAHGFTSDQRAIQTIQNIETGGNTLLAPEIEAPTVIEFLQSGGAISSLWQLLKHTLSIPVANASAYDTTQSATNTQK
jgi:hypothetical protein